MPCFLNAERKATALPGVWLRVLRLPLVQSKRCRVPASTPCVNDTQYRKTVCGGQRMAAIGLLCLQGLPQQVKIELVVIQQRFIIRATKEILAGWNTYDFPTVPTWHNERMIIIGDAAHAASPSSGQGASMAIKDAVVLAKCLRDEPCIEDALCNVRAPQARSRRTHRRPRKEERQRQDAGLVWANCARPDLAIDLQPLSKQRRRSDGLDLRASYRLG
jgi:hypothetical protein